MPLDPQMLTENAEVEDRLGGAFGLELEIDPEEPLWFSVDGVEAIRRIAGDGSGGVFAQLAGTRVLLIEPNATTRAILAETLRARRLLLLTPDNNTKHVVAEVFIGGRWIIVDPTYRVILKDAAGNFLTRKDLQNPAIFEQAVSVIPKYPREYTYDHFAHVRLARLPYLGFGLKKVLSTVFPGWEEAIDWSLLLERESFFYLVLSISAILFFLLLRVVLAWYADSRLRIPRFHFREHAVRAGAAFFSTPEIKQ